MAPTFGLARCCRRGPPGPSSSTKFQCFRKNAPHPVRPLRLSHIQQGFCERGVVCQAANTGHSRDTDLVDREKIAARAAAARELLRDFFAAESQCSELQCRLQAAVAAAEESLRLHEGSEDLGLAESALLAVAKDRAVQELAELGAKLTSAEERAKTSSDQLEVAESKAAAAAADKARAEEGLSATQAKMREGEQLLSEARERIEELEAALAKEAEKGAANKEKVTELLAAMEDRARESDRVARERDAELLEALGTTAKLKKEKTLLKAELLDLRSTFSMQQRDSDHLLKTREEELQQARESLDSLGVDKAPLEGEPSSKEQSADWQAQAATGSSNSIASFLALAFLLFAPLLAAAYTGAVTLPAFLALIHPPSAFALASQQKSVAAALAISAGAIQAAGPWYGALGALAAAAALTILLCLSAAILAAIPRPQRVLDSQARPDHSSRSAPA